MEKVVVFKISRGGQFNNSGYKSCLGIYDSFNADYFGINIYYDFENMTTEIREVLGDKDIDITDLVTNWDEENKKLFDSLKIKDDNDSIITHSDLGDPVILDDSGSECCTLETYVSNEGYLDIDGDYEKYVWSPVSNLSNDEIEIVIRDLSLHQYESYDNITSQIED